MSAFQNSITVVTGAGKSRRSRRGMAIGAGLDLAVRETRGLASEWVRVERAVAQAVLPRPLGTKAVKA